MSGQTCSTPISWLRLERYYLAEVGNNEQKTVADHLATCDACRALLDEIAAADDKTELPPLQIPAAIPTPITAARQRRRPWYTRPRTVAIIGGLALAAAILIGIRRRGPHVDPQLGTDDPERVKGSAIAFSLVREDSALVPEAGGPYHDGERFKALVTCPPGMQARFDVVVYENGIASFPLDVPPDSLPCGNSTPLPGAFRVTGNTRMTVCLVWQVDGVGTSTVAVAVDRDAVRRTPPDLLLHAQCKILEPASSP